ncbi:hypothetical protein JHK84_029639 [Glycine max]|nr:hypothetical protein JHK84_029639 [Glycine max]
MKSSRHPIIYAFVLCMQKGVSTNWKQNIYLRLNEVRNKQASSLVVVILCIRHQLLIKHKL